MAALSEIDVTPLLDAGFKKLSKADYEALVAKYKDLGMDNGGTFDVGYELRRDTVTVFYEQNISTIIADGVETMTKHPAVATVAGPRGKVTCPADDTALILAMADEVR